MSDEKLKTCPFCGEIPFYDEKNQTVRCETLSCGIHSWWLTFEEWQIRNEKQKENNIKKE